MNDNFLLLYQSNAKLSQLKNNRETEVIDLEMSSHRCTILFSNC